MSRPLTRPCTCDSVSIGADGAHCGLRATTPIGTATDPSRGSLYTIEAATVESSQLFLAKNRNVGYAKSTHVNGDWMLAPAGR